jgi:hypothetical protein
MALSDERLAELTYRLKGPVTNPLDWWCEADDLFKIGNELLAEVERLRAHNATLRDMLFTIGRELLAEVERLRSWLRECDVAIGGDGSDDSLLGLVYTCGEGKAAMTEVERLRAKNAELVKVLRGVEWYGSDGETYWCPICGEYDHEGHLEDCSLAAALKEASDE